jgi:hypothetical protein
MERLIPAAESDRLFRQVCSEIRHASAEQVAAERDPLMLLATALAEDPADREDIDHLLQDDDAAAALLSSAPTQIRAQTAGSVAVHDEQVLRWQSLGTVVGDDKAIAAIVDRVAAARADDETVMSVVALAREYLAGWRPSEFPFGASDPVIRQAINHPHMIFSPSVIGGGWPALLIRAVTSYEVDPAWAARADVSGAEFHHRLTAFLDGVPLAGQIAALASARALSADTSGWEPDQDAHQFAGAAVQRLILGPADQPAAVLRYAAFLPSHTGPMRLMTDIALSPNEVTDAKWGRLGLEEVRDTLATATEAAAGLVAGQILRSIYSGEIPPRTAIELFLWSAQGQSGGRPSSTLNNMIDLDALGPSTRPDQPALQGMFAVAGDTPTATAQERRNLVVHALIRMALDWGYLDARARLVPLASS